MGGFRGEGVELGLVKDIYSYTLVECVIYVNMHIHMYASGSVSPALGIKTTYNSKSFTQLYSLVIQYKYLPVLARYKRT